MNKKDKKMLFKIGAIIIALVIGCIFYKQRVEIITFLFALIGITSGISGMIVDGILGIVSVIVIYLIINRNKPTDIAKKLAYESMLLL